MPKEGPRGPYLKVPPTLKAYLDDVFGKNGRAAIDELLKIAKGETTIKTQTPINNMPGAYVVTEVVPSFKERIAVWELLLAYQQGRPKQQLAVEHSEKPRKYDVDRLTLAELEEMKRLEEKAAIPELESGDVVDAELVETKGDK